MGQYVIKTLDYCAEKGLQLQWEKGLRNLRQYSRKRSYYKGE